MPRKSAEAIAGEAWRRMNAPPPPPPEPPAWLSEAAAKHWREIVAELPPDYFDVVNQYLLEMLCNHVVTANRVWSEINKLDLNDPKQWRRYRSLSLAASRESRMTGMLLTKLRLLPPRHVPAPQPLARQQWESIS